MGFVFAYKSEAITFNYNNKTFTYSLDNNIKQSQQFDINYKINKHKRFYSTQDRINLLKHMISIGFDKEIALNYIFPNLSNVLNSIEKNIYIPPKDATLKINPSSEKVFHIFPETIGISLNKQALINTIYNSYISQSSLNFNIPTIKTTPNIISKFYSSHTYLRSDFSTNISSSNKDRKHNIKNALQSLNKIEILPNEIFSFNKTVGKRTIENGYRQAKIIINNEFVDGIGGGVCQVSSTLYNAALLAGLEIIEANKHSKQVSYVKSGFDAMVNFGSSDLKFRNNTSKKITIITNFSNSTARIRLFGENPNNTTYKLSNEIFNIVEPIEEVYIDENEKYKEKVYFDDEYFYLKTANKGVEIKSYREKYINSTLISKDLLRHDKFKVQNAVKIYGSKKRLQDTEKSTDKICA